MSFLRASRAKLVWALELALGLELYACAVLALNARGLRATPLLASPGLVVPALVIPPVFYVLVGLVSVRPLSVWRVIGATGAMCGVHAVLVVATGALFVIPDLVDYGAAVAFSLWGSPAVTMLQLTAAPLVLARLRPLMVPTRPGARGASTRHADTPRNASVRRGPDTPASTPSRRSVSTPPSQTGAVRRATAGSAQPTEETPAAMAPQPAPVVPEQVSTAPAVAPGVVPLAIPVEPTLFAIRVPTVHADAAPGSAGQPVRRALVDPVEPMVRVAFSRLADQLPVEMFARGRQGLSDMLRPGVSLFVPRGLLLPYLAEDVAPVKWQVVADQFPRDELVLTDTEIAERLPDGSLLLPLDDVVPQIPAELWAPSKHTATVAGSEELTPLVRAGVEADEVQEFHVQELAALVLEPAKRDAAEPDETEPDETGLTAEESSDPEPAAAEDDVADVEVPDLAAAEIGPPDLASSAAAPAAPAPPTAPQLAAPETPKPPVIEVQEPVPPPAPEPRHSREADGIAVNHEHVAEARRMATLLAPVMNGLEIGGRDDAGTRLVTAIAPPLSDDAVVATALRVVPWLSDLRLPEPVSQATLATNGTTIVLTPFESSRGAALLVAAVASRGSLARLERLSRSVAGKPPSAARNGTLARADSDPAYGLRPIVAPPSMRELASSLRSFGPAAPALLGDTAGLFRVCLFGPSGLDPGPLAQLARDLFNALDGTKIGPVTSVTLRLQTHRLVTRALGSPGGQTTLLVVVGPMTRPGLVRLELERAAKLIEG